MVTKRQRRRRLAREKWERQRQRRVERARKRRRNGIVVGTALGVVIALVAGFVIVQLVGGDSSDGAETGAPQPAASSDSGSVTAAGDRLPYPDRGSTFQVTAPSTGVVESAARVSDPTTGHQPTAGRYVNGVDRHEASVVIDKPKILA